MIFELERVSTNLQCDGDGLALVKVNIQKIQLEHCARTEWKAVRRRWYRSGSGSVTTIGDTVWNEPVTGQFQSDIGYYSQGIRQQIITNPENAHHLEDGIFSPKPIVIRATAHAPR